MSGSYDFSIRINNFMQCQCLQAVAQECADVIVIDCNGSQANAKSLLSLMTIRARFALSRPQPRSFLPCATLFS